MQQLQLPPPPNSWVERSLFCISVLVCYGAIECFIFAIETIADANWPTIVNFITIFLSTSLVFTFISAIIYPAQ